MNSRRNFLIQTAVAGAGFLGLQRYLEGAEYTPENPYGNLLEDPHKIIDLPEGFTYRVLSRTGDPMDGGLMIPGQPDGMAAFPGEKKSQTLLVRNHEIGHQYQDLGPFRKNEELPEDFDQSLCYDPGQSGKNPFVGGTTTVVYDHEKQKVVRQFLSLFGTDRNCAGGPTPWGTWVTCEEPSDLLSQSGLKHGYCFEVVPSVTPNLSAPQPLRDMGRFRHEAVAVHPKSGIVYLTEDRGDGLIYRFIPNKPGQLVAGGRLQAMALRERPSADTRNWPDAAKFPLKKRFDVEWIDLEDVESKDDSLRYEGYDKGAALFTRAEGMWYAGADEKHPEETIYWCCTDGGRKKAGQIFRYFPSPHEGTDQEMKKPGSVELYLEPNDTALLEKGDNITIAPWGDLIICEDGPAANMIRGVTPEGGFYTLAINTRNGNEFAGACFGPDGKTMFVNIQKPGVTLAITGPWKRGQA